MKIIIDGYNLLKQALRSPQVSMQEKEQFLKRVDRYARAKNHEIAVVFDGGEGGVASKEYFGDLLVLYSGHKESADDLIGRLVEKFSRLDILLVSSDREVRQKAAQCKVTSVAALDFYTRLEDFEQGSTQQANKKTSAAQAVKTARTQDAELDALMRQASTVVPKKTSDDYGKAKKEQEKRLTKTEKALLQKVKKL